MKTIEINLYKFDELSEEAQEKAIENNCDINVDYNWWKYLLEDAKNIGLKINGFDIYRYDINNSFMYSANEVAQNILNEHGETCDTYKTAEQFMAQWQPVFADYMDETSDKFESAEAEEELLRLEDEFKKQLSEDYLSILRKEYYYRTEEEQIIETLVSNDYDFTINGEIY